MKKKLTIFLFMILILNLFAAKELIVGAKMFTEGYIVSNLVSELLKENGFKIKENFGLSSFPLRKAIETGQVDIYPEYTGTAWAAYFKKDERIYDPVKLFELVAKEDLERNSIVWLDMINFNNTYGMAVRREFSEKNNIYSLSDLSEYLKENKDIIFGVNPEYYQRADGIFSVLSYYEMDVPRMNIKTMEAGLTYTALNSKKIDVSMVYSTDALILKYDLIVLNDDKNFFPAYYPSVMVRKEILDKYPEIKDILKPLKRYLNEDIMIRLNYLVDVEGYEPKVVAQNYLKGLGFIK
ncbi:glycine/betaine ABC transporter substrate-binding protein [Oceanotoga sp. DSM 15011]|uniref:ABC transporter substrate-binding protein n=1 Tax=Oceanotoga sp. DSM 15011 TaxID=2984951 RepID=UPI0021F45761|nr:glycine betaine ABC transporter substrate-binding protein [Oceanotoga sp. DSM 15011]UYP01126.1 glycine/betaine ABC transporter substrate-binding protein [Oceanotoga sp. DSM 15011]